MCMMTKLFMHCMFQNKDVRIIVLLGGNNSN